MNPIIRMMKRYINMPLKYALPLLFIGALVLASTTGCVTTTNTTSSGSNNKDVSSGLVLSAKAVIPSPQINGNNQKPKAGNVYVVYNCTVKNTGANGVNINPYYMHLRGANGYYTGEDWEPVVAPDFSHIEQSHVGDVASGYVYFQVPSSSAKGPWTSIQFSSGAFANQTFDVSVNI